MAIEIPKSKIKKVSQHNQNSLRDSFARGAQSNFSSRYNKQQSEADLSNFGWMDPEEDVRSLKTQFLEDTSRTIIAENTSPDVGFTYSINPYRGCEHGCIYCYARPTHEYFGLSPGLDFESKIFVKYKAPELLREKLQSKSWVGETIFFSGVTDCYQPAERRFELTRECLKVLLAFRNPVGMITKNQLIRRDIDLFREMTEYRGVKIFLSVTTLNADLARILEPRTSLPVARLKAIEELAHAGVPVGVNVAPVIPGLTDHEMPSILKAARDAGAEWAGYVPVRLPSTVAPLFEEWLETHFVDRKNKVLNAVKAIREGKLNDPFFGSRMQGTGVRADTIAATFEIFTKKYGLNEKNYSLSSDSFRKVSDQMSFEF